MYIKKGMTYIYLGSFIRLPLYFLPSPDCSRKKMSSVQVGLRKIPRFKTLQILTQFQNINKK